MLVHDCWASHFNTAAITHQICISHLLRDLNYLSEPYRHKWSSATKLLLQLALNLKKRMQPSDYYAHNPRRLQLEDRLSFLLNYNLPSDGHDELPKFQKQLKKYNGFSLSYLGKKSLLTIMLLKGRFVILK